MGFLTGALLAFTNTSIAEKLPKRIDCICTIVTSSTGISQQLPPTRIYNDRGFGSLGEVQAYPRSSQPIICAPTHRLFLSTRYQSDHCWGR